MRRAAVALCLVLPLAARAGDGTVRGDVRITTVTPQGQRAEKADQSNVVVFISDFEERVPPGKPVEMRQVNRAFVPDVLAISVGQSVDFFNADARFHNVFSKSRAADFDLGTFKSGSKVRRFDEPGLVDVYCNIHETMAGTILVIPNRAFFRTGPDGRFELSHVPPGRHTVTAWLRNGKVAKAEVMVAETQPAVVHFDLEQRVGEPEHHLNKVGQKYAPVPKEGYRD